MRPGEMHLCLLCKIHPATEGGALCSRCRTAERVRQATTNAIEMCRDLRSDLPSVRVAANMLRALRMSGLKVVPIDQDPHPSAADSSTPPEKPDFRNPLQDVLAITGATQHRPYTALSQIDQIVRKALAPG